MSQDRKDYFKDLSHLERKTRLEKIFNLTNFDTKNKLIKADKKKCKDELLILNEKIIFTQIKNPEELDKAKQQLQDLEKECDEKKAGFQLIKAELDEYETYKKQYYANTSDYDRTESRLHGIISEKEKQLSRLEKLRNTKLSQQNIDNNISFDITKITEEMIASRENTYETSMQTICNNLSTIEKQISLNLGVIITKKDILNTKFIETEQKKIETTLKKLNDDNNNSNFEEIREKINILIKNIEEICTTFPTKETSLISIQIANIRHLISTYAPNNTSQITNLNEK